MRSGEGPLNALSLVHAFLTPKNKNMNAKNFVQTAALLLVVGAVDACIPYAVGSTARPAPLNETRIATSVFAVPAKYVMEPDTRTAMRPGMDIEARRGISPQADVGIRVPSLDGFIINYKRRLDGPSYKTGPGIAVQVGGGLVHELTYGEVEGTIIASGGEEGLFTPYGGLRGVYTVPMGQSAERDDPVYGGFLGMRLGSPMLGISTEVGVFRESDTYRLTTTGVANDDKPWLVVPSITLHLDFAGLVDRIRGRRNR